VNVETALLAARLKLETAHEVTRPLARAGLSRAQWSELLRSLPLCVLADAVYEFMGVLIRDAGKFSLRLAAGKWVRGWISDWKRKNCEEPS
jgi:hypothetical protein